MTRTARTARFLTLVAGSVFAGLTLTACGSAPAQPTTQEVARQVAAIEAAPAVAPKVETAKVDKPKAEKPKADKPKADKPKADKPKAGKPKADKPKYSTEGLSVTANLFHNVWLDSMDARSTADFRKLYLPSCELCETMADDLDAQMAEGWTIEGGASGRGLHRLASTLDATASKDTGSLTGLFETQAYAIVDASGTPMVEQPAATVTYHFAFELVDGTWKVADLTGEGC